MIQKEDIKKLRGLTNLGIMDCKRALEDAGGDISKALKILKEKGIEIAQKKSFRTTSQGLIEAYVHFDGSCGSLVEINCETDFVAHTQEIKSFAKDIAMQVVAKPPLYIKKEDVGPEVLKKYKERGLNEDEFYRLYCLMEQEFIKEPSIKISDYLNSLIAKVGENVVVRRFQRFALGDEV